MRFRQERETLSHSFISLCLKFSLKVFKKVFDGFLPGLNFLKYFLPNFTEFVMQWLHIAKVSFLKEKLYRTALSLNLGLCWLYYFSLDLLLFDSTHMGGQRKKDQVQKSLSTLGMHNWRNRAKERGNWQSFLVSARTDKRL